MRNSLPDAAEADVLHFKAERLFSVIQNASKAS